MLYVIEHESYRLHSPPERVHDVISFAPSGCIGDGGRLDLDFEVKVRCGAVRVLHDGQELLTEAPLDVAVCADCLEERA